MHIYHIIREVILLTARESLNIFFHLFQSSLTTEISFVSQFIHKTFARIFYKSAQFDM